jgi:hypothetical protein
VTLLETVYAHPLWTAFLVLVVCLAVGQGLALVAGAITEPLAPCRRGNCPRCRGTGGEPLIRKGAP